MSLEGTTEMLAKLRAYRDSRPKKFGAAMYAEMMIERNESMARTPVRFGALRGSHEVHRPEYSDNEITVRLTVGGPAAGYAPFVHENLDADHPNGGQAKFLESTILESSPFMAQRIAARLGIDGDSDSGLGDVS